MFAVKYMTKMGVSILEPKLNEDWKKALQAEFKAPYFLDLKAFLIQEKAKYMVYPPGKQIFAAFDLCPPDQVRVVIVGQDPYHGEGQANGLCFSVSPGTRLPPSLKNIFKELKTDLGCEMMHHGDLSAWAKQGVLLLNTSLTVRAASPASHSNKGWEQFTDNAIRYLSMNKRGIVFLLWGNHARLKEKLIDSGKHFILTAAHPSPLSAYNGFFGCRHFSRANKILIDQGRKPIHWCTS
jgi:uracil-DNA glycosylase